MIKKVMAVKAILDEMVEDSYEVARMLEKERDQNRVLNNRIDFLTSELDASDLRNLEKHNRLEALRESQAWSEERELAMLSQLIDVQVQLDRLRQKFVTGIREADNCTDKLDGASKCDYCRGKAQAWNTAILFLDGMVSKTFWGDAQ